MNAQSEIVGTYRQVLGATGTPNADRWAPCYGIRRGPHGPQVLVDSFGGRAWINIPARDIRPSAPNLSLARSLDERSRELGRELGRSVEGMENLPTAAQEAAALETLAREASDFDVTGDGVRSAWGRWLGPAFTEGSVLGKQDPAGARARIEVRRQKRREARGE